MNRDLGIGLICGSAELGRDGVGDYSRRFAKAWKESQGPASIIAAHDSHVSTPCVEQEGDIRIHRLPSSATNADWQTSFQGWLTSEKPGQIFLQYVPFAYQKRGLPFTFFRKVMSQADTLPIHWMCHEIACGLSRQSSLKERLLGLCQKKLLAQALKGARSISTSNPDYQARLAKLTTKPVHLLPLFSNIEHRKRLDDRERNQQRIRWGVASECDLLWVLFGRIASDFPRAHFLAHLEAQLASANRRACIISVGRIDRGESAWAVFQKGQYECIRFQRLGELPTDELDTLIQCADFGLATTPLKGIGKSSTAMVILERGKPLVGHAQSPNQIGLCPGQYPPNQVIRIDELSADMLIKPPVFNQREQLEQTVESFLKILDRT